MKSQFEPLSAFFKLQVIFKDLKIPYGLIGGWAVIAWGSVRATRDVDILAEIPAKKRTPFETELRKLGWVFTRHRGGMDDPVPELLRITYSKSSIPQEIDILPAVRAFDRDALKRARNVEFEDHSIPVICPEDLIAMKLFAGGPLDIEDAKTILEVQKSKLDIKLLEESCKALKVSKLLKKLLP